MERGTVRVTVVPCPQEHNTVSQWPGFKPGLTMKPRHSTNHALYTINNIIVHATYYVQISISQNAKNVLSTGMTLRKWNMFDLIFSTCKSSSSFIHAIIYQCLTGSAKKALKYSTKISS